MRPSLGLESATVVVVPYDQAWPALFDEESARLRSGIAPLPVTIEHSGSTSVPGLAAKPVLDMLAGYADNLPVEAYLLRLVDSGYTYRGEQGIPGRHFFRRGDPRAYHVHLTRPDSPFWRDQIKFRNHLRTNPESRDAYAALKIALAARFPRDREAYIAGKTAFVRNILLTAPPVLGAPGLEDGVDHCCRGDRWRRAAQGAGK